MTTPSIEAEDADVLVVPPARAAQIIGVGITRLYELLNAGSLESYLEGRVRRITVRSLKRYVEQNLAKADLPDAARMAKATAARQRQRVNP